MKTILIVIAGLADFPDPITLKDTPLISAQIPSLDLLARRGELTAIPTINPNHEISHKNALLSIMGYDLQRGEPSLQELMEYGLDTKGLISDYQSLRPFVIPGFSGHGVCVTPSAWVRGVAKCALLKPVDLYAPGAGEAPLLETMAEIACQNIIDNEFVFVYMDSPLLHLSHPVRTDRLYRACRVSPLPVRPLLHAS